MSLPQCAEKEVRPAADAAATKSDAAPGVDGGAATVPTTFASKCTDAAKCGGNATCVAGVCVPNPGADQKAVVTDPFKDFTVAPDPVALDCVDKTLDVLLKDVKGPATVTMWGRIDRFGGGDYTVGIEVAVFKAADFHPEVCAGVADFDARAACFVDDAKVGKPLATALSIDPDKAADAGLDIPGRKKPAEMCVKHLECMPGYDCQKKDIDKICQKAHGLYAIDNVPTNTRLVIRVRSPKPTSKWHTSYLWDLVPFADRLDVKGADTQPTKYVGKDTIRTNPTIVGDGQWTLVPNTLGLGSITEGNGVLGGRIRDCGVAGGRRGWAIHNAKVALGVPAAGLAFFNDNEDNTVPVKTSSATDVLGRWAAVDVPAGANRVAGSVLIDGKVVPLGGVDVFVIPDALVIVSMPGRIPELSK
ncbi:MAG: hypothetical protein EXR79_13380 [Myxococcales bacterium]|nr:hypothetical protein [Myxococcales bacterium]